MLWHCWLDDRKGIRRLIGWRIATYRPVPNYAAWWRGTSVNDSPSVAAQSVVARSPACTCWLQVQYHITNTPHTQSRSNQITRVSLQFNGHFPGGPGLAGTRMSPFCFLSELRMMEVVSGDNWSCKTCKCSSQNVTTKWTNTWLFTGQIPFLTPNQQCSVFIGAKDDGGVKALKGKPDNHRCMDHTVAGFELQSKTNT